MPIDRVTMFLGANNAIACSALHFQEKHPVSGGSRSCDRAEIKPGEIWSCISGQRFWARAGGFESRRHLPCPCQVLPLENDPHFEAVSDITRAATLHIYISVPMFPPRVSLKRKGPYTHPHTPLLCLRYLSCYDFHELLDHRHLSDSLSCIYHE